MNCLCSDRKFIALLFGARTNFTLSTELGEEPVFLKKIEMMQVTME